MSAPSYHSRKQTKTETSESRIKITVRTNVKIVEYLVWRNFQGIHLCLQVDLLGDEVEALLGILEEVQIAFDIYAPVLHHYPKVTFVSAFILHNSP